MEDLLLKNENPIKTASPEMLKATQEFCEGYKVFLDKGKTERECTSFAIAAAKAQGFVEYDFNATYKAGDKVYYNNRDRALCLAVIGKNGAKNGVKMVAAHVDSPRIDLKPIPLYETNELAMFKTHYYGGIKKFHWLAIPLAMHGVVVKKDGTVIDVCYGEEENDAQFCITDILPHLGKDQREKPLGTAIPGEDLNIIVGCTPAAGEEKDAYKYNAMKMLNEKYGIIEADLISAEIEFVPAFKAKDLGFDRALIGSYGHDDRVCAYPAMIAAFDCGIPESTVITVFADKEEVGSQGNSGLRCDFLKNFVTDLAEQEGLIGRHVLAKSSCLSADVTAAFDPTYAYAYDIKNSAFLNHGAAFAKYTGSGGKGGCNDASAEFLGEIRQILDGADVSWQIAELGKVDQGGGGTVAAAVANLNVDVIDIGVPVLSMHAPYEVVSKYDVYMTYQAILAYYKA
ncbi:MAG: aminopeptidase [Clostridia bacterium]